MPRQDDYLKKLREDRDKASALSRLFKSDEYQTVLLPLLKKSLGNKWVDPSGLKQDDFYLLYLQARAKAVVYADLINLLASQEKVLEDIDKKMKEPVKNYSI